MKKRVVISEEQYNRVFLNEETVVNEYQKTIAKLYREWANSSEGLSKKYGKKSVYDLDEISSDPYGGTFLKSYKVGKIKFDSVWLSTPSGSYFINLSKGGSYKYSYDYKTKNWWHHDDPDSGILGNQINPNETYWYRGKEEVNKLNDIWANSVKSKGVSKLITKVEDSIKKEKGEIEYKKASADSNIESVRKFLLDLGFGMSTPSGYPNIMPKNPLSGNHLMAQSALNATRYLTSGLISDKVISTVKGNVEVCVTSVGSTCAPPLFYTAKYFDYEMGKVVSSQTIGNHPAQFVVYLTNFYFDFGKLQKDLDDTFKSDKDAFKSNLFPDGWWGWFNAYWGTNNLNVITQNIKSISASDIPNGINTINKYKTGGSIWAYLGDCFTDYHCALDIASIAALAIPGVGPMVSMGIDFVNAGAYGVEAASSKNVDERNMALLAGGLTLFGGFLGGGVGQTRRYLSAAEKNPKIYSYANEVISRTERELPMYKNFKAAQKDAKLTEIYEETKLKYGLNSSDVAVGHGIIQDFSKIDLPTASMYSEALSKIDSRIGRANLRRIGNDSRFKNLVLANNGDVVKSLSKFVKTQAGKEALTELGLFIVLTEAMEIPEVQQWIAEKYNYIKYVNREDIRGLVEKEGYQWEKTKQVFGSNGSTLDNSLLTNAWKSGWRPFDKNLIKSGKEITLDDMNLNVPEKFQTTTFKERKAQMSKVFSSEKIELAPKEGEERKEGVKYYEKQEHIDMIKQPYGDIDEKGEEDIKKRIFSQSNL